MAVEAMSENDVADATLAVESDLAFSPIDLEGAALPPGIEENPENTVEVTDEPIRQAGGCGRRAPVAVFLDLGVGETRP